MTKHWDAIVVGAGPAGLSAAEVLAGAGHSVLVLDAKPSVARKFLMAGKSGLNLTKSEDFESFSKHFGAAEAWLSPMIAAFDSDAVQAWATALGQEIFVGSTGRVFPKVMKASPLLRAWVGRLQSKGVEIRTRWRWCGWQGDDFLFQTDTGPTKISAKTAILALGGASWARLGSDGQWAPVLQSEGVELAEFAPSNSAVSLSWSRFMEPHFGSAIKSVRWKAGDLTSRGEAILSKDGLEGGGLYPLTPALRKGAAFSVDLAPDLSCENLRERLPKTKYKARLTRWLKGTLRFPAVKVALVNEIVAKAQPAPTEWPELVKNLTFECCTLRAMDEAISTSGGVRKSALSDDLMLHARPGVFCAGEMLDWEAPTGGYLLTACFATGRWAGHGAVRYLRTGSRR